MITFLIVLGSILLVVGTAFLAYKKLYPSKKDIDDDFKYVLEDNIEEKVRINEDPNKKEWIL